MYRLGVYALFIALIIGLAGCANLGRTVDFYTKPDADMGYIYGKFNTEDANGIESALLLTSYYELDEDGNVFPLEQQKKYGIEFNNTGEIYAVAVEPGIYKVSGFQLGDGRLMKKHNDFAGDGVLSREIVVRPGKAYYVGEWHGEIETASNNPMAYKRWKLTKLDFYFDETNKEFAERYPHFDEFPREMLFTPGYSKRLNKNNKRTYNVRDLRKAVGFLDHELAFKMATHLAKKDSEARAILAYLYEKGLGVEKDFSKAISLYTDAAKKNSSRAMYRLSGLFFEWGDTEPKGSKQRKDYMTKGATYLTSAALYGDERAVASHCRMAESRGSSESLKTNAWAWCFIGKKMLTENNRDAFNKTLITDENRASLDIGLETEVAKQEKIYIKQMKKNGVNFIR